MKATIQKAISPFIPGERQTSGPINVEAALPSCYLMTKRVLLLDDDENLLDLVNIVKDVFKLNMRITTVSSIAGARSAILHSDRQPPYDIMIFDVVLANGNGIELYKELIAKWPRCNVVFLTGYYSPEVVKKIEAIGPAQIRSKESIVKPEFLAAMLEQLGVKRNFPC